LQHWSESCIVTQTQDMVVTEQLKKSRGKSFSNVHDAVSISWPMAHYRDTSRLQGETIVSYRSTAWMELLDVLSLKLRLGVEGIFAWCLTLTWHRGWHISARQSHDDAFWSYISYTERVVLKREFCLINRRCRENVLPTEVCRLAYLVQDPGKARDCMGNGLRHPLMRLKA